MTDPKMDSNNLLNVITRVKRQVVSHHHPYHHRHHHIQDVSDTIGQEMLNNRNEDTLTLNTEVTQEDGYQEDDLSSLFYDQDGHQGSTREFASGDFDVYDLSPSESIQMFSNNTTSYSSDYYSDEASETRISFDLSFDNRVADYKGPSLLESGIQGISNAVSNAVSHVISSSSSFFSSQESSYNSLSTSSLLAPSSNDSTSETLCVTGFIDDVSRVICYTNDSLSNITDYVSDDPSPSTPPVAPPFNLFMTIFIATCIGLCIIITVFGNLLVLTAFVVERSIRQPSNYFICSLAVSDLIIGVISMPFYAIYVLKGTWDLGPIPCDLWLSVDHTVCLVSIYTVLLITVDRYCSVKYPTAYRTWRSKNKVLCMVTVTWILPFLIFFISIMGWEYFIGYRDLEEGECAVQFLKDPVFNTSLIFVYFYCTLVVLFVLYAGIYKIASDMAKRSMAKARRVQGLVVKESDGGNRGQGHRNLSADRTLDKTLTGLMDDKKKEKKKGRPTKTSTSVIVGVIVAGTEAAGGMTTSDTLEALAVNGNSDQDRSSSPVFDSDEDEEDIVKHPNLPSKGILKAMQATQQQPHKAVQATNSGSSGSNSFSKKKKRIDGQYISSKTKSGSSAQTLKKESLVKKTVLIPRSPVVTCPPRISLPPDFPTIDSSCHFIESSSEDYYTSSPRRASSSFVLEKRHQEETNQTTSSQTRSSLSTSVTTTGSFPPAVVTTTLPVMTNSDNVNQNIPQTFSRHRTSVTIILTSKSPEPTSSSTTQSTRPQPPSSLHIKMSSLDVDPRSLEDHPSSSTSTIKPTCTCPQSTMKGKEGLDKKASSRQSSSDSRQLPSACPEASNRSTTARSATLKTSSSKEHCESPASSTSSSKRSPSGSSCDRDKDDDYDDVSSSSMKSLSKVCQDKKKKILLETKKDDQEVALKAGKSTKVSPHSSSNRQEGDKEEEDDGSSSSQVKKTLREKRKKHTSLPSHKSEEPTPSTSSTSGKHLRQKSSKNNDDQYGHGEDVIRQQTPQLNEVDIESGNKKSSLSRRIRSRFGSKKSKASFDDQNEDKNGDENRGQNQEHPSTKDSSREQINGKTSLVMKLSRRLRAVKVSSSTPSRTKSKSENRARKALRTISFILGAFVICWTPYHILALIQGFCTNKEGCVNHHLFYFTYFLCYANSPINPFCYAMANQQFKKTFYRILRGDFKRR